MQRKLNQGVRAMEDKEKKDLGEKGPEQRGEPIPFCTNAPSAEHSRGNLEEEPCDDARDGR